MTVLVNTDELLIVDRPELSPGYCIASMQSEDPKGFIDTTFIPPIVDPRIYLSVSYVESVARKLGMEHVGEGRVGELERENADLREQLREADRQLSAIEVLESGGFAARKKRGRPPKES